MVQRSEKIVHCALRKALVCHIAEGEVEGEGEEEGKLVVNKY